MKALKLYEEGQATIKLRLADGKIEADKILNTESGKKVKAALGNTFKPLTQQDRYRIPEDLIFSLFLE